MRRRGTAPGTICTRMRCAGGAAEASASRAGSRCYAHAVMGELRLGSRIRRVLAGNVLGAMITGVYFNRIRPAPAEIGGPAWLRPLPFFTLGFVVVAAIVYMIGRPWFRPLAAPGDPPSALARRRALLVPYVLAGLTLGGWVLAGLLWGIVWPLLAGTFTPTRSADSCSASRASVVW